MQVTISSGNNINGTLILPLFQGEETLPEIVEGIRPSLKSQVNRVLADGDFEAKANATMTLVGTEGGKAMLVGLGKADKADAHAYREAGATVVASFKKVHGSEMTVLFHDADLDCMTSFAEGMMLRDYSYDLYKKTDDDEKTALSARINCNEGDATALSAAIDRAASIVSGVHLSRDLETARPTTCTPWLLHKAELWAEQYENVTVQVIDYEEAKRKGMGGLVAVGMGSSANPAWSSSPSTAIRKVNTPCWSAKASPLTPEDFTQTGGQHGRNEVRHGRWFCHRLRYHGPGIQRLPQQGGRHHPHGRKQPPANAQRPGDAITTFWKTIEVLNTDAEGRWCSRTDCGRQEPTTTLNTSLTSQPSRVPRCALGHEAPVFGPTTISEPEFTRLETMWANCMAHAASARLRKGDDGLEDRHHTTWSGSMGKCQHRRCVPEAVCANRMTTKMQNKSRGPAMDIAGTYWAPRPTKWWATVQRASTLEPWFDFITGE